MSTRYVWGKRTYSNPKVSDSFVYGNASLTIESTVSIVLCSSYVAELNSYGKPVITPSGSQITISTNTENDTFYPASSYKYLVCNNNKTVTSFVAESTEGYWGVVTSRGAKVINLFQSQSSSSSFINRKEYDLTYNQNNTRVSSASSTAYTDGFSNIEKAEFYYLGSDNIDPKSISYAPTANIGDSITLTIEKSSSISYGGTITYVIEKSYNNGSFLQWSSVTSLTTSYTATSYGTEKFMVHAKDNYGFESTTYVTGPILSIAGGSTISLSVSPTVGGSVSGEGTYSTGSSVTVIASPNSGYTFSHWLEGSTQVSTNFSYTFTASGDRTLTAVFTQTTTYYTVSVSVSPSAGGSVSGGGSYSSGSSVTVRAIANSGYNFTGWYEGGTLRSTSTAYTFAITENRTFTAQFSTQSSSGTGTNKNAFIGIDDIAKRASNIYIGVGGVAKKVKNGYIGVDGKARLFYSSKEPAPNGYKYIEYIQFVNNSAYFELSKKTGKFYNLTCVDFDWSIQSGSAILLYARTDSLQREASLTVNGQAVTLYAGTPSTPDSYKSFFISYSTNNRHTLTLSGPPYPAGNFTGRLSADGVTNYLGMTAYGITSVYFLYDPTNYRNTCNATIYGIKFYSSYEKTVVLKDFVPVMRESDGIPMFYEKVSKELIGIVNYSGNTILGAEI